MDTAIPSIPPSDLFARLGSPRWPVVLDVRRPSAYDGDEATR